MTYSNSTMHALNHPVRIGTHYGHWPWPWSDFSLVNSKGMADAADLLCIRMNYVCSKVGTSTQGVPGPETPGMLCIQVFIHASWDKCCSYARLLLRKIASPGSGSYAYSTCNSQQSVKGRVLIKPQNTYCTYCQCIRVNMYGELRIDN